MIDFNSNHIKWPLIGAGLLCFIIALVLVQSFSGKFTQGDFYENITGDEGIVENPTEHKKHSGSDHKENWTIYVTGAVLKPGVYTVETDSRIHHAITVAGGFSPTADPESINLAEPLTDGMHIKVPQKLLKQDTAPIPGQNLGIGQQRHGISEKKDSKININTADAAMFQTLPGIGPKMAERIVINREKQGCFTHIDDLMRVKGIGKKSMEQLREYLSVY